MVPSPNYTCLPIPTSYTPSAYDPFTTIVCLSFPHTLLASAYNVTDRCRSSSPTTPRRRRLPRSPLLRQAARAPSSPATATAATLTTTTITTATTTITTPATTTPTTITATTPAQAGSSAAVARPRDHRDAATCRTTHRSSLRARRSLMQRRRSVRRTVRWAKLARP